jgi:trans-2,3-dihydro-3-hydroxyanthranilate isomerase
MEKIAIEFNFSETVFVFPSDDQKSDFQLRIFTPGGEIPFAGHPTIGTAFLLAKIGKINLLNPETKIYLKEIVGNIPVSIYSQNNQPISAELTAPKPPEFYPEIPSLSELAEVISLAENQLTVDEFSPQAVSCGLPFLLIPIIDVKALANAKINLSAWEKTLSNFTAPHVYLFCEIDKNRWRVRMFAPALNIAEDPATGSAATAFSAYLAQKQGIKDGIWQWQIEQGIEMGRASEIKITAVKKDGQISKITVGGECVLITEGILSL